MSQRALFLDRDGVINKDIGYAFRRKDLVYINGIFSLCKKFYSRDFKLVIVTNQSGIARGYYSEKDFHDFMKTIKIDFATRGIEITDYFYCPHLPNVKIKKYNVVCQCRKPKPGMIFAAARKHSIDLSRSILIGDNITDVKAGISAGIPENYLFSKDKVYDDPKVDVVKTLSEINS